jgi:hypothetical protein
MVKTDATVLYRYGGDILAPSSPPSLQRSTGIAMHSSWMIWMRYIRLNGQAKCRLENAAGHDLYIPGPFLHEAERQQSGVNIRQERFPSR